MNASRIVRRLSFGLLLALAFALAPAAAHAEGGAASLLRVKRVYYGTGRVQLASPATSTTAEVALSAAGSFVATATADEAGVVFEPYRLKAKTAFTAVGYDAAGTELWRWTTTVDPAAFRPARPTLNVTGGKVVGSRWSFSGDAHRPVLWVRTYCYESDRTWKRGFTVENNDGEFFVGRVAVPYGGSSFDVVAMNGFGSSPKATVNVYYLGSGLPHRSRYVVVCKRTFWLYDVHDGRVIHKWPVAIGTPRTPTPRGTFYIGRRQSAGGDWGVLRRPLYRKRNGHYVRSGYYIHGTNAPWSIGTMASHGCVRMYNSNVRSFAKLVPNYTFVLIK